MGRDDTGCAHLSIGALSRATGIPVETLRTWESRYGYPAPVRKPSGHRVYPVAAVARLQRIALVLAHGYRAGDVVAASDAVLSALLDETVGARHGRAAERRQAASTAAALVNAVATFDGEAITRDLLAAWAHLGPLGFLRERLAPALQAVGEAWATGALEVRHERFFTERVQDLLRSLRLPFEEQATGPLMVGATLAGERHGLGLQMAALVLAVAGWRVCQLGVDVPADQVARLATDLRARAVAVSVSSANQSVDMDEQLERLRDRLSASAELVVGGRGAPKSSAGIACLPDLDTLDTWARQRRFDA